jgi:hypothetical protein
MYVNQHGEVTTHDKVLAANTAIGHMTNASVASSLSRTKIKMSKRQGLRVRVGATVTISRYFRSPSCCILLSYLVLVPLLVQDTALAIENFSAVNEFLHTSIQRCRLFEIERFELIFARLISARRARRGSISFFDYIDSQYTPSRAIPHLVWSIYLNVFGARGTCTGRSPRLLRV